jgi:hypothetical protein
MTLLKESNVGPRGRNEPSAYTVPDHCSILRCSIFYEKNSLFNSDNVSCQII